MMHQAHHAPTAVNAPDDAILEAEKAAAIFGHAAHFFTAAADMILKGAPYHDPEVQRMIDGGYEKLAKVREREAVRL